MLTSWNLYDEDYIEDYLNKNGKPNDIIYENNNEEEKEQEIEETCFLFEGKLKYQTVSEELKENSECNSQDKSIIDVIFLTKQDNSKKLHSHLWLYRVFCMDCNPEFVVVRII